MSQKQYKHHVWLGLFIIVDNIKELALIVYTYNNNNNNSNNNNDNNNNILSFVRTVPPCNNLT